MKDKIILNFYQCTEFEYEMWVFSFKRHVVGVPKQQFSPSPVIFFLLIWVLDIVLGKENNKVKTLLLDFDNCFN